MSNRYGFEMVAPIALAFMVTLTPQQSNAQGLLDGAVKWVGDRTGAAPLQKLGKELGNASTDIKAAVPVIAAVEAAATKPVAETVKYADNHREEVFIAGMILASAAVACADGCSMAISAIASAGGGTVAKIIYDSGAKSSNEAPPPIPRLPKMERVGDGKIADSVIREDAKIPKSSDIRESDDFAAGFKPRVERVYPGSFSVATNRVAPSLRRYVSPRDDLYRTFNAFSSGYGGGYPYIPGPGYTDAASYRVGDEGDSAGAGVTDPIGGEFNSRRKLKVNASATTALGAGARRTHAGVDILAMPGAHVKAPMSGWYVGFSEMKGQRGLGMMQIEAPDGTLSRILYAAPSFDLERRSKAADGKLWINAGERIGRAQAIGVVYKDEPNHIHIDAIDPFGRKFNPWTDEVIRPMQ